MRIYREQVRDAGDVEQMMGFPSRNRDLDARRTCARPLRAGGLRLLLLRLRLRLLLRLLLSCDGNDGQNRNGKERHLLDARQPRGG